MSNTRRSAKSTKVESIDQVDQFLTRTDRLARVDRVA